MSADDRALPTPYAPRIILILIALAAIVVIIADILNNGGGYQPRGYYPVEHQALNPAAEPG